MKKDDKSDTPVEVKWWEAKQGVTPFLKKQKLEKKANKHAARKAAQEQEEKTVRPQKKNRALPPVHSENIRPDSALFDTAKFPADAKLILENFNNVVSSNLRLNSKQRSILPHQILELSHQLTDERGSRRLGYMNSPGSLTAYIHYFLRWNLVRLVRLFSNMENQVLDLKDGDICLDIGSGPLTVPIALFMARPELRQKKITFYCMDISQNALALGEDIFLSTAAALKCEPWKIIRVKGEFGTVIKEKATFVTCANVFNEIVDDFKMPPDYLAKKYTEKLLNYTAADKSRVLIIEPGVPKAARFVSLMRDALMRKNYRPLSPCTHCGECPMDGRSGGKWCNFAFSTLDAPHELKALSQKAGLAKERAVLSFVALLRNDGKENVQEEKTSEQESISFRIASDRINLPFHKSGYYACSEQGLLLVQTSRQLFSGQKFTVNCKSITGQTDEKSGALIVTL